MHMATDLGDAWAVTPEKIVEAGTVQIPKTGQTTSYAAGDDG